MVSCGSLGSVVVGCSLFRRGSHGGVGSVMVMQGVAGFGSRGLPRCGKVSCGAIRYGKAVEVWQGEALMAW